MPEWGVCICIIHGWRATKQPGMEIQIKKKHAAVLGHDDVHLEAACRLQSTGCNSNSFECNVHLAMQRRRERECATKKEGESGTIAPKWHMAKNFWADD